MQLRCGRREKRKKSAAASEIRQDLGLGLQDSRDAFPDGQANVLKGVQASRPLAPASDSERLAGAEATRRGLGVVRPRAAPLKASTTTTQARCR